jgi:hypothetical protein
MNKADILAFMRRDLFELVFSPDQEHGLFSPDSTVSGRKKSEFFGTVNRALREHCIKSSEIITEVKRYGFLPAFLSTWKDYDSTLANLADQLAEHFEARTPPRMAIPPRFVFNQISKQIVYVGRRAWRRYVLNQRFISEELPSTIQLIEENPDHFPYREFNFGTQLLKLCEALNRPVLAQREFFIASIIAQYLRSFRNRECCYPRSLEDCLNRSLRIAETLYVYAKYSPKFLAESLHLLTENLQVIEKQVNGFTPAIGTMTLFDNEDYLSLMRMQSVCDPDKYIKTTIPLQIEQIGKIIKALNFDRRNFMSQARVKLLPVFERGLSIIEGNREARLVFCELFCQKQFPLSLLQSTRSLFAEYRDSIHTVWRMTSRLPQYVIVFSNLMIQHYKSQLASSVKAHDELRCAALVEEITSLVDGEFGHHPSMILARSSLLIPHQRESELQGRARSLLEEAHTPSRMTGAIAELFGIVPHVKARRDLFQAITDFMQKQLMSQIKPHVDLERQLIDAMGQFTETEYLSPLQSMLSEFAARYDDFEEARKPYGIPDAMAIAVLSMSKWKSIIRQGVLFDQYASVRRDFEVYYARKHSQTHLIWCDPSSIIQVRMRLGGHDLLFLFNGMQWAIVICLINQRSGCTIDQLSGTIRGDDLSEQISTLVKHGLVLCDEPSQTYQFNENLDLQINRNFAKKYTSAENLNLLQIKEESQKQAIRACIVSVVKARTGQLDMGGLVQEVRRRTLNYFPVDAPKVRAETQVLETLRYIKITKVNDHDVFEFVPATGPEADA